MVLADLARKPHPPNGPRAAVIATGAIADY